MLKRHFHASNHWSLLTHCLTSPCYCVFSTKYQSHFHHNCSLSLSLSLSLARVRRKVHQKAIIKLYVFLMHQRSASRDLRKPSPNSPLSLSLSVSCLMKIEIHTTTTITPPTMTIWAPAGTLSPSFATLITQILIMRGSIPPLTRA